LIKVDKYPPYYGPEWEKKIRDPSNPNFWKYGVANLVFLDFIKGRKLILDVGCGTGGSTFFLAEHIEAAFIIGVDVVKSMIQVAKQNAHKKGFSHKTEFIVCEGRLLPFKDSNFEALISRGDAFVFLIPQDKALQEFNRILSPGAILVMEMDNHGALTKWGTETYSFQKMHDGKIVYIVETYDFDRNHRATSYVLKPEGKIAKEISREQGFVKNGHLKVSCSFQEIQKETTEIRQGLLTHWPTPKEIRKLLETNGYVNIEVKGNGLFMKLLLEGEKTIVKTMKNHPQIFFEVERRLIPQINPDRASTIIVKALKP